jgi:hypothetical protein
VRLIEVAPLDLAVVARLLAVSLGFVVLLAILEESVRGVVMGQVLRPLLLLHTVFAYSTVTGVQLFQNLATGL